MPDPYRNAAVLPCANDGLWPSNSGTHCGHPSAISPPEAVHGHSAESKINEDGAGAAS
jgi:hypothetical protein